MYVEMWLFWTVIIVLVLVLSSIIADLRQKIVDLKIQQQKTEEKLIKYVKEHTK